MQRSIRLADVLLLAERTHSVRVLLLEVDGRQDKLSAPQLGLRALNSQTSGWRAVHSESSMTIVVGTSHGC